MPKFFITEKDEVSNENIIIISEENVNHIKNVLRYKKGDFLVLCNGCGTDFTVRIINLEKEKIITEIVGVDVNNTEPPFDLFLFQAIPKGEKMEFIIQKAVELGIKAIIPVITKRTIQKFDSVYDMEKKKLRWQKISYEASMQCNRGIIPEVILPITFDKAISCFKNLDLILIPHEKEKENTIKLYVNNIKSHNMAIKKAGLFIGPEGGFSDDEITLAVKSGGITVSLGSRILRTETAAIAAIVILMYEIGDLCK